MGKCPLCAHRQAKRSCPAKRAKICPLCCGTQREIEIDCPSDCVHLQQGQTYRIDRQALPLTDSQRFTQQFIHRHAPVITALAHAVVEEWRRVPDLVDQDARDAFTALRATMNTLSAGIYYENLPLHRGSAALYTHLKRLLDGLMQPGQPGRDVFRVTEAVEVLDFMRSTVELHSSGRPRSRRYLAWLRGMAPEEPKMESSRRIVS